MEMLASCVEAEAEAEERHGCERPALRLRLRLRKGVDVGIHIRHPVVEPDLIMHKLPRIRQPCEKTHILCNHIPPSSTIRPPPA